MRPLLTSQYYSWLRLSVGITDTLRQHNGNITRTARALGLTRRGLQLKLSRYNLAATA